MRAEPPEEDADAIELRRVPQADTLTPADRYQELFVAVQTGRVFEDSKTFVDCAPRRDPEVILEAYRRDRCAPGFDLGAFVHEHFVEERPPESRYVSDPDRSLAEHIDYLWDVLTRHPRTHPTRSSLLPVPRPYVVPGGRFRELYYWDSYFTMLGLAHSGRIHLLRDMVDNFAYLIGTFGHVPNGNRSYYLSRSQPPLFALMVRLLVAHDGSSGARYVGGLRKEHAFWMDGAEALRPGDARRHCVRLEDGALLCRYWDDRDTPREESYLEDVSTAKESPRAAHEVYRELRAGAASGWDFSTRWCDEGGGLPTIRTTTIVPVDLNCFLHALEVLIAELSEEVGDEATAADFQRLAVLRQRAIERWLWDEASGAYMDLDLERGGPRTILHAATVTPLFVGIASPERARRVSATLREHLLEEGGLATTKNLSGEQWDAPNGWAPLQWLAIRGLERYGETPLSTEITRRWLETVASLYERESKLVEKYVVRLAPEGATGGGGGEYPLQDGFGWTNGVTGRLLREDPVSPSHRARAGARRRR